MAPRFNIPQKLEELELVKAGELRVPDVPSADSVSREDVVSALEDGLAALRSGVLSIGEQETLEQVYVAIRGLPLVGSMSGAPPEVEAVASLGEAMCQNLLALVTSGLRELAADAPEKSDPVVVAHVSALHAYAYFLQRIFDWFCVEQKLEAQAQAQAQGGQAKKRGAKSKAAADAASSGVASVWPALRERLCRALSRTMLAELDVLYATNADRFRLVRVCVLMAVRCLSDPLVAKGDSPRTACYDTVCAAAARFGAAELAATELLQLVQGQEHGPEVVAAISEHEEAKHESTKLLAQLVSQFCDVDPATYDEMAGKDSKPVKHLGELLAGLARRQPAAFNKRVSLLLPYFGCQSQQAVSMRSNLVHCLAHLMAWYHKREASEAGMHSLKTSRQQCAILLVERANDKAALVRKAALDSIHQLLMVDAWPLALVTVAANRAVARLQDSSLPAGAALGLLITLVRMFGDISMNDQVLVANIEKEEQLLEYMRQNDPSIAADGEGEGEGDEDLWRDGQQPPPAEEGGSQAQPIIMPTQMDGPVADGTGAKVVSGRTYQQARTFVANLKLRLELSRTLNSALPELLELMQSNISERATTSTSAIELLTLCCQANLQGAAEYWRRVWHMIFNGNENVRATVLDAFYNSVILHEGREASTTAEKGALQTRLHGALHDTTLRDQQSFDELVRLATQPEELGKGGGTMDDGKVVDTVRYMLQTINSALTLKSDEDAAVKYRHAVYSAGLTSVLCAAAARHRPELLVKEFRNIAIALKMSNLALQDPVLVRNLASMLGDLAAANQVAVLAAAAASSARRSTAAALPAEDVGLALKYLYFVLLSLDHLPTDAWYSVAQAAVGAIYKLHPRPYKAMEPLLQRMAEGLTPSGDASAVSAVQLSRVLHLVGCTATQQLVLLDSLTKRVREEREARAKAAIEARGRQGAAGAGQPQGGEGQSAADDVDAQLGTSQAADAQLDALQTELEAELLSHRSLVGCWGAVAQGVCSSPLLLGAHEGLASCAVMAMCKLMLLDVECCDVMAPLFFTLLTKRLVPATIRCDMLVALGDLYRRHPNVLDPWTTYTFQCLNAEPEPEVRRTCLRMLSHLIVSSIIKPRGKMACVARCLVAYEEDGSGKGCAAGASEAQQPEQGGVRGVQGEAQGSQGQGRADGELAGEQSGQEGDEDLEEEEEDEEEEYGAKPKGKRGRKPKGRKSKGQSDKGQQKDGGSGGAKAEAKARAARGVAGGGADVGSLEGGSLRSMALCLFNTLASKQMKGGGNLVNQYLPEIIAQLVADGDLSEDDFRSIMTVLLGYIKADKLSDGTKARLCERFQDVGLARRNAAASTASAPAPAASAAPSASCKGPAASSQSAGAAAAGPSSGTQAGMEADAGVADSEPSCSYTEEDVREWRSLADCLSMFEYSEKGLRNVVERLRYYKHALGDEHVYRVFKGMASRRGKHDDELRALVTEWEAQLDEAQAALREEEEQRRRRQEEEAAAAAAAEEAIAAATAAASGQAQFGAEDGEEAEMEAEGAEDGQGEQEQEASEFQDAREDGAAESEVSRYTEAREEGPAEGVEGAEEEVSRYSEAREEEVEDGDGGEMRTPAASSAGDGEEAGSGDGEEAEGMEMELDGEAAGSQPGDAEESEEEYADAEAEEDQQEEEAEEEAAPADEMELGGTTPCPPRHRSTRAGPGPVGTPMSVAGGATPAAARTPLGEDMAWSPAPSGHGGPVVTPSPARPLLARPAGSGGHSGATGRQGMPWAGVSGVTIKPDPEGGQGGVYIKPDPEAGKGVLPLGAGVRIKPDPEGAGRSRGR